LVGRREAVDVENESGEDGGGDVADAFDGVEMVWRGQPLIGLNHLVFQPFLASLDVAQLADLIADEFLLQVANQ